MGSSPRRRSETFGSGFAGRFRACFEAATSSWSACHRLGIEPGQTTPGGELTVEFAECLGVCDHAPAALADDGRVFGPLAPESLDVMLDELKQGRRDPARPS